MSNFEQIRQRYGLKEVNIATWRDPRESVLPLRGGPRSPAVSAEAAGKVFAPSSYKVKYRLPQPTDDEESEDEETESAGAQVEPALPTQVAELPPEAPPAEESSDKAMESSAGDVEPGLEQAEVVVIVETPSEAIADPAHDGGIVKPDEASSPPAPPSAPSLPPIEPPEAANTEIGTAEAADIVVETTSPTIDESFLGSEPPSSEAIVIVDVPPAADSVVDLLDLPPGSEHNIVEVHSPAGDPEDQSDRKVSFAPGTPEPKPTSRKKKSLKGTKSKSKKKLLVPADSLPDDIIAVIDESPAPLKTPSGSVEAETGLKDAVEVEPTLDDQVEVKLDASPGMDGSAPAEEIVVVDVEPPAQEDPLPSEGAPVDAIDLPVEPAQVVHESEEPLPLLEPAPKAAEKKMDSESASEDKVKLKQKSSKSQVKEDASPPPLPIDLLLDIPMAPRQPDVIATAEVHSIAEHTLVQTDDQGEEAHDVSPTDFATTHVENEALDAQKVDTPQETNLADENDHAVDQPTLTEGVSDMVPAVATTDEAVETDEEEPKNTDQALSDVVDAPSNTADPLEKITTSPVDSAIVPDTEDKAESPKIASPDPAISGDDGNGNAPVTAEKADSPKGDPDVDAVVDSPETNDADALTNQPASSPEGAQVEEVSGQGEDGGIAGDVSIADHVDIEVPLISNDENAKDEPSTAAMISTEEAPAADGDVAEPADQVVLAEQAAQEIEAENLVLANEEKEDAKKSDPPLEEPPSIEELAGAVEDDNMGQPISDGHADDAGEDITEAAPEEPGTGEGEMNAEVKAAEQPATETADAPPKDPVPEIAPQPEPAPEIAPQPEPAPEIAPQPEPAPEIVPEPEPAPEVVILEEASEPIQETSEAAPANDSEIIPEAAPEVSLEAKPDAAAPAPLPEAEDKPAEIEPVVLEPVVEDIQQAPATNEVKESPSAPSAPPSPTLSKGSSTHRSRADHWQRPTKAQKSGSSGGKPSGRESKDGGDSPRKHRTSRRTSFTAEDERRRREARKAKEDARWLEEERKRVEDEERRAIRHAARREARRVLAEAEMAKIVREEAEAAAAARKVRESDSGRRRRRDSARDGERPPRLEKERDGKTSSTRPSLAKAYTLSGGESVTRTAPLLFRTSDDRRRQPTLRPASSSKRNEDGGGGSTKGETKVAETLPKPLESEQTPTVPSSSGGSHRRHRSHRSGEEGSSRPRSSRQESDSRPDKSSKRDSERHGRRPVVEERSRSFWGSLFR